MAAILFRFSMVLDKMAAILFIMERHRKTEHHWKTGQRATIGILNAFGCPAPTAFVFYLDHQPIKPGPSLNIRWYRLFCMCHVFSEIL